MRRRDFMRSTVAGSVGMGLAPAISAAPRKRPNVLVILADDMGFSDLGCYGGEINTPNLDKLAKGGVRFSQFYNAARCCPTRASLLTGLYPQQAGVGGMVHDEGVPSYQGFLDERSVTMAEMLKGSGYKTYMAGKWHVGNDKGHWPLDRGFDRYFGLINGASNFFNNIYYRNPNKKQTILLDNEPFEIKPTTEDMWKQNQGFYMTDDFTDYALQFLDEHNKKENDPFFLYLAYTAPHWPLHAFPEDIEKYKGKYSKGWDQLRQERYDRQKKMGLIDDSVALAPLDDKVVSWEEAEPKVKKEFETEMEIYAAMIDRMDQNIGRVVKKLEQMGELENTFIVFLSDNGGCHTTPSFPHLQGTPGGPNSFPCYGYMGAELSNVPFRKYKQYIHEGGIATPCIVHYPAMVKRQNRIEDQAGHIIDILPTVADLCGAAYPEKRKGQSTKPLPGMSLKPALQGKPVYRGQPIYWEHVRNKGMRDGDWKLVAAKPDLNWELYNLRTDRAELHDLSQQYPSKKQSLIATWEKWAKANRVKPFHK